MAVLEDQAVVGSCMIAVGLAGYLRRPVILVRRFLFIFAGAALLLPFRNFEGSEIYINFAGAILSIFLLWWELRGYRPAFSNTDEVNI